MASLEFVSLLLFRHHSAEELLTWLYQRRASLLLSRRDHLNRAVSVTAPQLDVKGRRLGIRIPPEQKTTPISIIPN